MGSMKKKIIVKVEKQSSGRTSLSVLLHPLTCITNEPISLDKLSRTSDASQSFTC